MANRDRARPPRPMPHFALRPFAGHGLITAVLCCLIALALTLSKNGAWDVQLAYSLGIGLCSWLVIELGRHWLRGPGDIPWPMGWRGIALIVCSIPAWSAPSAATMKHSRRCF